jgi:aminopeptidase N
MKTPLLAARALAFGFLPLSWAACAAQRHSVAQDEAPPAPIVEAAPAEIAEPDAPTTGAAGIGDEMFPTLGNGGYDVQRYELAIAFTGADEPIEATAKIEAVTTQRLKRFNLDFHGLEIRSLEVDGRRARFERDGDELVITLPQALAAGRPFVVEAEYSGVPEGVADPSMPVEKIGWLTANGEVYVLSEPSGAMTFFPCNDHPRDKALFAFRITVPAELTAVANGRLVETIDHGETRTFVYEPRDPMATYLATVAIADFDVVELEGPDGLDVRNYFHPAAKESARKAFERTPDIVAFLSQTFGPYPFEVCGGICASLRFGGALETQTIPIYGAGVASEAVIVHELAHQWFGNSVSVESWDDIWLNEGFASYAEWLWQEREKGPERFAESLVQKYRFLRRTKPSAPGSPTADRLFGANVYLRGPFVLHMLRGEVGDETFLRILRTWCEKHAHGNASVEQFVAHANEVAGRDLTGVLNPWLFDAEPPRIPALDPAADAADAADAERRREREERKAKRDDD